MLASASWKLRPCAETVTHGEGSFIESPEFGEGLTAHRERAELLISMTYHLAMNCTTQLMKDKMGNSMLFISMLPVAQTNSKYKN